MEKLKDKSDFRKRIEKHMNEEETKIEVRKYKESDKAAVIYLLEDLKDYLTSVDQWNIETRKPGFGKAVFAEIIGKEKRGNSEIFVAVADGKIIGFVNAEINKKDKIIEMAVKSNIKQGEVQSLYVDAEYRKGNVGRKLMSAAESYLKGKGCTHIIVGVFWPNEGARRFYEKNGYEFYNVDYIKRVS